MSCCVLIEELGFKEQKGSEQLSAGARSAWKIHKHNFFLITGLKVKPPPHLLPALGWLLSSGTNLRVEFRRAALPGHGDLPLHLLVLAQGPLLVALVVEQDSIVQVDEGVAPAADTQDASHFLWEHLSCLQ